MPFSNIFLVSLVLLATIAQYECFLGSGRVLGRHHGATRLLHMKWPGDRPPIANMEVLEQRMDATWGRAKFRTEVWEDDVNPLDEWWTAYAPSEEEIEAAAAGYDFKDPKGWFEGKGIDYEKAVAATDAETEKRFSEHMKKKKAEEDSFTLEDFAKFQEEFFDMQRKAFKMAFRLQDNKKQEEKGQPSLDVEDTGEQWKNDPI